MLDRKAACFELGGYLKGDKDKAGHYTLLQCEIESCNRSNCNNHVPSLSPTAVTVFTPTGKYVFIKTVFKGAFSFLFNPILTGRNGFCPRQRRA